MSVIAQANIALWQFDQINISANIESSNVIEVAGDALSKFYSSTFM
jgi:hypothetical protein